MPASVALLLPAPDASAAARLALEAAAAVPARVALPAGTAPAE